jgi:hypothetical protein
MWRQPCRCVHSDHGADLPAAPTHDPEMPAVPKISHTGVVYDEEPQGETQDESSVNEDLLERMRRLKS